MIFGIKKGPQQQLKDDDNNKPLYENNTIKNFKIIFARINLLAKKFTYSHKLLWLYE